MVVVLTRIATKGAVLTRISTMGGCFNTDCHNGAWGFNMDCHNGEEF